MSLTKNGRVLWSCASCKRVGSIPMRPEWEMDAIAMSKALSEHHEALGLCNAQNVDYMPDWMLQGILREVAFPSAIVRELQALVP